MPLTANEKVCWEPRCDSCGEGDNSEYGGSFHYGSREEAVEAVQSVEWVVRGDMAFCASCIENEDYPIDDVDSAVTSLLSKLSGGSAP